MSETHITISHLTDRGWRIWNLNKYTHTNGSELYRDESRARWYLARPNQQPKYVGSTLKVAIETVLRITGGGRA